MRSQLSGLIDSTRLGIRTIDTLSLTQSHTDDSEHLEVIPPHQGTECVTNRSTVHSQTLRVRSDLRVEHL